MRSMLTVALGLAVAAGCGGGGHSHRGARPTPTSTVAPAPTATPGSADNVAAIGVDSGPNGTYVNGLFITVTVCAPLSTSCSTVDHVLVDTGSSGLRILASALSIALPTQTDLEGNAVGECFPFLDSFTWGPVRTADVVFAHEKATSVPVQVIGDSTFAAPPEACTSTGLRPANDLAKLGAKGIFGIGVFQQDCGSFCATSGATGNIYFGCGGMACTAISEPLESQVQNPVSLLPQDNNGVVIDLPSVPEGGAASVTGSLMLGIGTDTNNGVDDATVLPLTHAGTFTTLFNGQSLTVSFIDTGSNGLFFLDAATTGIPTCNGNADFYCPSSTQALQALQRGTNGTDLAVGFEVANARSLFANQDAFAYGNLAGPGPNMFDWGLPFFYGRRVLVAIEGQATPAGPGPYIAY